MDGVFRKISDKLSEPGDRIKRVSVLEYDKVIFSYIAEIAKFELEQPHRSDRPDSEEEFMDCDDEANSTAVVTEIAPIKDARQRFCWL